MKKAKKLMSLLAAASVALSLIPAASVSAAQNVTVSIPDFDVFLNGEKMDNRNSEYPLIIYRDITYVPMTWNLTRFMGLKTRFDRRPNGEQVFFIGNTVDREPELIPDYDAGSGKSGRYTAVIPEYKIAANDIRTDHFINNEKEQYPILNFRDITYFPLTWKYAHDCFGWDYHFDQANGLAIDSRNAFRPEWQESVIWSDSPTSTALNSVFYVSNDDAYVGWKNADIANEWGGELIWGRRNQGETTVDLTDSLVGLGITSLTDTPGEPELKGGIFTAYGLSRSYDGYGRETGKKYYRLKISLLTGQIIKSEELLFNSSGQVIGTLDNLDGAKNVTDTEGESDKYVDLGDESDKYVDLNDESDKYVDLGGGNYPDDDPEGDNAGEEIMDLDDLDKSDYLDL